MTEKVQEEIFTLIKDIEKEEEETRKKQEILKKKKEELKRLQGARPSLSYCTESFKSEGVLEENDKSNITTEKLLASTQPCQLNTEEDRAKRFNKRPGFAKICGVLYEVKMCMLVFLRLLNLKARFRLCSNLKEAEDFDDVVVHYNYNNENKGGGMNKKVDGEVDSGAIFIQLKHTDNENKIKSITFHKGNPDFRLLDYFLSFSLCDNYVDLKHEIFSCDPDKRLYIIFTNANVDTTLLSEDTNFSSTLDGIIIGKVFKLKQSGKEFEEFSEFLENLYYIFYGSLENQEKSGKEINHCINTGQFIVKGQKRKAVSENRSLEELKVYCQMYKDINIEKIMDFFLKMRICCCQANVLMLDSLIKHEISTALTVSDVEAETVLTKLRDSFIMWHDSESYFLMQDSKIWTDISKETRDERLKNKEMRNLGVKFGDESVNLMREKIKQFNFLMIVVEGETTTLSTLKIWQALEAFIPQHYLLVSITECTKQSCDLWNTWPSRWCKTLVIEFDANCEDVKFLTELLTTAIISNPLAQVFLICSKSNSLQTKHIEAITDNVSFNQLEKMSKEQILHKSKINFQGQNIFSDCILQEKHISMLGINYLTSLIRNELTLGRDISDYQQKVYISRNIEIPCISDQIFHIKERDTVVAIKLLDFPRKFSLSRECKIYTVKELIKLCNENPAMRGKCCYVTLKDGEETKEFEILCEKFSNVHWIENNGEIFVWKRSKGQVYSIRNCLNYSKKECEEKFLEMSLQMPVVISGEPGMGKSSLLKHMALLLQEKYQYKWIVLVELAQYCEFFKNCGEMTEEKMFEFIINVLHLEFDISFFKENPEILENFIILLDGFDEICPYYINEVLKLTEHLVKSSYFLCITCRENYCSYLEEKLCVISYKIEPLNTEMKEKLLIQCLEGKRECLTEETQSKNIRTYLKYFGEQYDSFTENPLNLLMLFEICDIENAKLEDNKVMPVLNILEVFTKYIEKKYERFHTEKTGCDINIPSVMEEMKKNIKEIISENKRVSAYQIFYDELTFESSETKQCEMSQSALHNSKNVDIIEMVGENDFVYTHKLFVEYFAALWLVDNCEKKKSIVKKVMYEKGFETVRQFYDLKCLEKRKKNTYFSNPLYEFGRILFSPPAFK